MEFMLEIILDIKNNKKKSKEDPVHDTRLKKWLQKRQERKGRQRLQQQMASLSIGFGAASGSVFAATAATTKSSGGSRVKKGIVDWILGGLQKEDQLLETDPILKKAEEKSRKSTTSVSIPSNNNKKSGGRFRGLFAKK